MESPKILDYGTLDHGWFYEKVHPDCNGGNIPIGVSFICEEDEWIIDKTSKPIRIIKKIRLVSVDLAK